jgi:hypothetical protein
MASLNKQQKRANRAKTKAKQQRVARSVRPAFTPDDMPLDIDYLSSRFDDDLLDDEDDLFGPDEDALIADLLNQHFEELKKAESVSQFDMLLTFFRGPLALAALAADDTEPLSTSLALLLARYWEWAHGTDPAISLERMEQPDFIDDFDRAFEIVAKEGEALMAAEGDLLDPFDPFK